MQRPPRARSGPPPDDESKRRPRRPDFLTPDDEDGDPFGASSAHRAATPRRGRSSPSADSQWSGSSRPGDPHLTLPSMPRIPARRSEDDAWSEREEWRDWYRDEPSPRGQPVPHADDEDSDPAMPASRARGRRREHSSARPLSLMRQRQVADALDALTQPSGPLLGATGIAPALPAPLPLEGAYAGGQRRSHLPVALARPRVVRRVRVETQRIARAARSPWTGVRFILALAAITMALLTATARVGEPVQPLMLRAQWAASGGSRAATPISSLVRPETQIVQSELYDSYQQFLDWQDAACSAATTSEVLTAWGVKNATIGQVIDRMGPDISLNGGLINEYGFQRAAAAYGYRADISHSLTYQQMLYITNQLGLPIIVNVRISYGYYHFFDTGHFLVMTSGDNQGVAIVDSSTYYIHYLPLSVFFSMFTGRTYIIVPKDYNYSVPSV